MTTTSWTDTLRALAARAEEAGVFASVQVAGDRLECAAREAAAPAFYRVDLQNGRPCVSLVTPDRWLSQSIEQELVHTGDKMEELLDEELADLGSRGKAPKVDHFRSDDKLYTFRSLIDRAAHEDLALLLLAYEATFRHLGDMAGGDDE